MMEGEVPLLPIKKQKVLLKKMDAIRRADEVNGKLQIIKIFPVRVQTTLAMTKFKTENFLSYGKSILIKRKTLPRSDLDLDLSPFNRSGLKLDTETAHL